MDGGLILALGGLRRIGNAEKAQTCGGNSRIFSVFFLVAADC